jgi:hypothetical protein
VDKFMVCGKKERRRMRRRIIIIIIIIRNGAKTISLPNQLFEIVVTKPVKHVISHHYAY